MGEIVEKNILNEFEIEKNYEQYEKNYQDVIFDLWALEESKINTETNPNDFSSKFNELKNSLNNIQTTINNNQKQDIRELNIKKLYILHKEQYSNYMYSSNTKNYAHECINHNNKLFELEVTGISSIQEKISGNYKLAKRTNNSFRTFLTFLEKRGGLDPIEIDKIKRYVKGGVNSGEDEYVPTLIEINNSIKQIKNTMKEYDLNLYYALIESGARWIEIKKMINEYDPRKHFHIGDDISYYKLFWIRSKKKAFYLFFRTSTLNYIVNNLDLFKNKPSILSNYKGRLKNKNIISTKYLRKTAFTQMVINDIQYNIADLFQGRVGTVSAKHYLGKEEVLSKEYEKYLNKVLKTQIL